MESLNFLDSPICPIGTANIGIFCIFCRIFFLFIELKRRDHRYEWPEVAYLMFSIVYSGDK